MFEGRASHTALYFLVEWAKQHEYEELDYGICKPFLKDGIFIYKREWGMKIKEHKDQLIYALKACNFGKGARDFLADSPIIFVDGQCLKGLVFIDKERLEVKELRHIFERISCQVFIV